MYTFGLHATERGYFKFTDFVKSKMPLIRRYAI
jgi:hypothetical protein